MKPRKDLTSDIFFGGATVEPLQFYQPRYIYHQHLSHDPKTWLKVRRTCISTILRTSGIGAIAIVLFGYATCDYEYQGYE